MSADQPPVNDVLPTEGRLAGVDFGTVRIGVAICDPGQRIASPLENYTRRTPAEDARWFVQLVEQETLCGFVVGLPIHTDGSESTKSIEARAFAKWLTETTARPVAMCDERYSTAFAEQMLAASGIRGRRRQQRVDKVAAQLILSAFLESRRAGASQPQDASQSLDDH